MPGSGRQLAALRRDEVVGEKRREGGLKYMSRTRVTVTHEQPSKNWNSAVKTMGKP